MRKKNTRQRGSKTHGCGSMKKRRGAGNRGGRGRAGSGKRADQKKPSYWKDKPAKGFKGRNIRLNRISKAINLKDIDQRIEGLVVKGLATKKGDAYELDLKNIGYSKVLGIGKLTKKITIKANSASEKAKEKAKVAGSSIISAAE